MRGVLHGRGQVGSYSVMPAYSFSCHTSAALCACRYYFQIGSVDSFERKLDAAQVRRGVGDEGRGRKEARKSLWIVV